jgi:hypothetical protein
MVATWSRLVPTTWLFKCGWPRADVDHLRIGQFGPDSSYSRTNMLRDFPHAAREAKFTTSILEEIKRLSPSLRASGRSNRSDPRRSPTTKLPSINVPSVAKT